MTLDVDAHWQQLVTVALLGTDRRDPPTPTGPIAGPIADLVADAVRPTSAERMLAEVAATTAVRRAGLLPASPVAMLAGPAPDDRPVCVPAAVDRWRHIASSWAVLEDEWTVTLIEHGWRLDPELVPLLLMRHRRDPIRSARVRIAAGPLGEWLAEHVEGLAPVGGPFDDEQFMVIPALPIPPELDALRSLDPNDIGTALVGLVADGTVGVAHRAVLVNLIARVPAGALRGIARVLDIIDPTAPFHGLAASLADLARTRDAMLDDLRIPNA